MQLHGRRDDPEVGGGGEGGDQKDGGEGRLRGLPGGRPPLLEAAPQAVPQLRGCCRVDQASCPAQGCCSGRSCCSLMSFKAVRVTVIG
jgi:hypothetical protein